VDAVGSSIRLRTTLHIRVRGKKKRGENVIPSKEKTPRELVRELYTIEAAIDAEIRAGNSSMPVVQKMISSWEQEGQQIRENLKQFEGR